MLGWGPWAVEVLGLSVFGLAWSVVGDVDGLSWAGGMARRTGGSQRASLFMLDAVDRLHTRKSHSRRLAKTHTRTHVDTHTHTRARAFYGIQLYYILGFFGPPFHLVSSSFSFFVYLFSLF